jgi:hypothetical protein
MAIDVSVTLRDQFSHKKVRHTLSRTARLRTRKLAVYVLAIPRVDKYGSSREPWRVHKQYGYDHSLQLGSVYGLHETT